MTGSAVTMTVTPRTSMNSTRHSETTPSQTDRAGRDVTAATRRARSWSPASLMTPHYPGGAGSPERLVAGRLVVQESGDHWLEDRRGSRDRDVRRRRQDDEP